MGKRNRGGRALGCILVALAMASSVKAAWQSEQESSGALLECAMESSDADALTTHALRPSSPDQVEQCLLRPSDDFSRLVARFTLVDVRRPDDFARYHVIDSLNLPSHRLASSRFLYGRSLLLLGNLRDLPALIATCARLGEQPFETVRVFAGDVAAWPLAERLQGAGAVLEAHAVSPADFVAIQNLLPWKLLYVDDEEPSEGLHELVRVRTPTDIAAVVADDDGSSFGIMLIDREGRTAQQLLLELDPDLRRRTFVLEGGLAAYHTFERQQRGMLAQRGDRLSTGRLTCSRRAG